MNTIAKGEVTKPAVRDATALSASSVIAKAEALRATLIEQQVATEKNAKYSEITHRLFSDAGFYKILVPRKFGGLELGAETHLKTVMAVARGCASTAWQLCFGSSHAINTGLMFDEATQAKIFDGDFICPMTVKPQGKILQSQNGEWRLTGTFNYCSGIPFATHFMSHALPVYTDGSKGPPVTFLARRGDWKEINDWGDTLGLKGSGSNSISFEGALIPDQFVLRTMVGVDEAAIRDFGKRTRGDNAMYYGRTLSWLILQPASIAVGAVKGALDEYAELTRTKTTIQPPITLRKDDSDFRGWFGGAIGKLSAAEAAILHTVQQWSDNARKDKDGEKSFSAAENFRLALVAAEAIDLAWKTMEAILWRTAGTTPTKDGQRMQRIFRDLSMIRSHAFNSFFDKFSRELADEVLKRENGSAWD